MEKIIVRDKILERGHANSAYINLCNDKEYNTTIDFLQDYNYKILLNKIYGEVYTSLIPWFYADSKKYLGDTWWEKDFEIINDLKTLSIVDFYKKYKGY